MARMYGLTSPEDLVGRPLDLMLPASDPAAHAYLGSIIEAGHRVSDVESKERDADGKTKYFANSMTGVVIDGRLHRMWGSQRDTIKALEMALKRRCPEAGLLHHSDQGCTYASEDYQTILDRHGITCSMSRRGDCHDNAVMESFFSTLRSELADRFASFGDAKMELFDYIEVFYNQRRRHSTLGQISPAAFERSTTAA
jgi:hypothetical protein